MQFHIICRGDFMYNYINTSKVDYYIDRLKKEQSTNGKHFLIGSVEYGDEEYCEILELSVEYLRYNPSGDFAKKRDIVTLALVLFAQRENCESGLWESFFAKTGLSNNLKDDCYKCIYNYMKLYNLFFHEKENKKMYVTTIQSHAIFNNLNLHKLYEVLENLYFKELGEDYYDEEVNQLCELMKDLFKNYIYEEEITFKNSNSKLSLVNQGLPISFRLAYIHNYEYVSQIVKRIIKYIHQMNYEENISNEKEDRFYNYFKTYQLKYNNIDSVDNYNSISGNRFYAKKRHRKPMYLLKSNKLYLFIPSQLINYEYENSDIYFNIYADGKLLERVEAELSYQTLYLKSEEFEVLLDEFYKDLYFTISSEGKELYNTGQTLFRDYILFDSDGEETNLKNGLDNFTILHDKKTKIKAEKSETYIVNNYIITNCSVKNNGVIEIGDKLLSVDSIDLETGLSKNKLLRDVFIKHKYEEYEIYSDFPEIYLRLKKGESISDFNFQINDKKYILEKNSTYSLKECLDGKDEKIAICNINSNILPNTNAYKFKLIKKGLFKEVISKNIFLIKDLHYRFDKPYYTGDKAVLSELSASGIEFEDEKWIEKTNHLDYFKVIFEKDLIRYNLMIRIPTFSFSFGETDKRRKIGEDIWHKEIENQTLFLYGPYNIDYKLYITIDNQKYELKQRRTKDSVSFDLENYFKIKRGMLNIKINIDGYEDTLCNVYFDTCIKDIILTYNREYGTIMPRGLTMTFNKIGTDEVYIEINNNDKIVKTYKTKDNKITDEELELEDGSCYISCYSIKKRLFSIEKEKIKASEDIELKIVDNSQAKKGDSIIKGIKCYDDRKSYKLNNFFIKDYEKINENEYRGFAYYKKYDKSTDKTIFCPYSFNPITFVLCESISTDESLAYLQDKDKDGLIYDKRNKFISKDSDVNDFNRYVLIDKIKLKFCGSENN